MAATAALATTPGEHSGPAPDDRSRSARRAELAAELLTFLPRDSVLTEPEELRPFECDGLYV